MKIATEKSLSERITNVLVIILFILLFLISIFLTVSSIFLSTYVNVYEHVTIIQDNILINCIVIAAFLVLVKVLKGFFKDINPRIALIVLLAYVSILGVVWIVSAQAVPRADQLDILRNLQKIINNDFSGFKSPDSYFQLYPFQLGILFLFEMLLRLCGPDNLVALSIINVFWLDMAYIAIVFLVRRLFNNRKIELLTILLLFACLQPILFCTFLYGNLMGLAFSLWAVYFVIKFIQTGRKSAILISAVLITVALLAKYNCSILLVAIGIILFLHFLKKRGWFSLVAIVLIAGMSLGVFGLVQKSYEWRSNITIGPGIPQTAWLEMGMQQNAVMYDGWYDGYPIQIDYLLGHNTEAIKAQIQSEIEVSIKFFVKHPKYAVSFFSGKTISQWDEPSFESIWVSEVPYNQAPPHPDWVNNLYYGNLNGAIIQYFDYFVEIIYVGFAAAMFFAIKRKQDLCFLVIPLAVLGGFAYHLFFEAKSQYILVYFIMMIPFAAWGYYQLVNVRFRKRAPQIEVI